MFSFEKTREELKKICTVESIMTSDVKFFEDFSKDEAISFCASRDITNLPCNDNLNFISYDKEKKQFDKIKFILPDMLVSKDTFIYSDELIDKFKENPNLVQFVKKENKLIGVLHFSDYNRNNSYIYLYYIWIEFESIVRKIINDTQMYEKFKQYLYDLDKKEQEKNNCNYKQKSKSENFKNNENVFSKMQNASPNDLLKFFNQEFKEFIKGDIGQKKEKDIIGKITNFRNTIMHIKDNVTRENRTQNPFIYSKKSFLDTIITLKYIEQKISEFNIKYNDVLFDI